MTDYDRAEPLSNISDSSFEILGHGSMPSHENDKSIISLTNGFNSSNITVFDKSLCNGESNNRTSSSSNATEDSIQEKLNQVLRENYQLRETLTQNNLALKSQLDTFFMWQQEVLKTHEAHKEKFLETKDLILKLRAENVNLKKQLGGENVFGNVSAINGHVTNNTSEMNHLNGDIDLERMCKELTAENKTLKMNNEKLKEDLKESRNETLKISSELEEALMENKFLKQRKEELRSNMGESFSCGSLPNSDARAQISNLLKQLEEERAKVSKLKLQLEGLTKNTESTSGTKCTTKELDQCITQLDDMYVSLDKQNQRFNSLQSWVTLAEENVNTEKVQKGVDCLLMTELKQMKSHLNQEENVAKEKQESLKEMREQFHKLLEDYKGLQLKLTFMENVDSDVKKYKDDAASLSEKLKTKDAELLSKQEECDKLKENIKKLELECEEVELLRMQMAVYQSDFKEEREARAKLVGEKEEMAEQVRILERKLENLRNEKEDKPGDSPVASSENIKRQKYQCPKCLFSYSTLQNCQEHIEECVGIDFYP